jgi:hypothetical protein
MCKIMCLLNFAQGWLFYPLSSPATDGASQPWKMSKERINFCKANPEKCKNIYRTLQISGGFTIGMSDKSRPTEEVTVVSWSLSHSKVCCSMHVEHINDEAENELKIISIPPNIHYLFVARTTPTPTPRFLIKATSLCKKG